MIETPEYARTYADAMGRTQYAVDGPRGTFLVTRKSDREPWSVWRSDSLGTSARLANTARALERAAELAGATIIPSADERASDHAAVTPVSSLSKNRQIRMAFSAAVAAATLTLPAPTASAAPATEDSASWDCRTMGNQVCGPTNDQGVVAGQYADGLLVPWSATEVPAWCLDVCRGA